MKTTVVPAQVTTVEDRIMGSLGFSQLMLLIAPIFIGAGIFAMLPPFMTNRPYKYVLIISLVTICCLLAIRIRGKIIALWILMIVRYNLRPRLYLFDKNTAAYREHYSSKTTKPADEPVQFSRKRSITVSRLEFHEAAKVLAAIDNPDSNLRFETTKTGGLHVRLAEVEK